MLIFFATLAGLIAFAGLAYWRWSARVRADIAEGAAQEWERLNAAEPAFLDGIDRTTFDAIFQRVHFPRFPKYFLAAASAFVLALPVVFAALAGLLLAADALGLTARPDEIAKIVPISGDAASPNAERNRELALLLAQSYSGFYYFFGVIAAWLGVVAFAARRFHARRPGFLRDELILAREANAGPSPETPKEPHDAISSHDGAGPRSQSLA